MENFLLILYICIAFLFGAVFIYWIYGIDYAYVFPAYCIGAIIACTFFFVGTKDRGNLDA